MNILKWFLGTILFVCLVGLAFWLLFYIQFNKIKPEYPENVRLAGILEPVNIEIDSSGVSHIFAQNEQDLVTAMGYYVAFTHLWEMELMRRSAQGRLSEVFGQFTFDFDLMFRNIQLDSLSAYLYQNISEESKRWLEWYINGVNEFISSNKDNLPIEFQMLEVKPERWKPADVLVVQRFIGWMINKSWKIDFFYWQVFNQLPPQLTTEILPKEKSFPQIQPDREYGIQQVKTFWDIDSKFRRWWGMLSRRDHPYGWVIGGKHTKSSKAILVNDEPLESGLPFRWVELHLASPELNVAGFAIPGIPGVLVGRNDKIAWGVTHLPSHETSLYLETLVPNQNPSVNNNEGGGFSFHKENIVVKNKDRTYTFLVSGVSHKQILKPSLEDIRSQYMVSLKWNGWYPGDEILCLQLLAKAKDWQSFREAISHFKSPNLNFVFADQEGNIGLSIAGYFPMTTAENKFSAKKDKTKRDESEGYLPFEQLPSILNPDKNWISNLDFRDDHFVNRLLVSVGKSEIPATQFPTDSNGIMMYNEIEPLLVSKHSPENFQILSSWLEILKSRKHKDNSKQIDDIHWILTDWKGGLKESSVASLVYKVWRWFVIKNVFADQMGTQLFEMFMTAPDVYMPVFERVASNKNSSWFDDITTSNVKESQEEMIYKSFLETIELLNNRLGEEIYRWQWENFAISLNTQHNMPNSFNDFLLDNAPIQTNANNIAVHLNDPGSQKFVVKEMFENQAAFVVDWNQDHCYRSINSTQFALNLVSFSNHEIVDSASEKKFKTVYYNKELKPLLNIHINPK